MSNLLKDSFNIIYTNEEGFGNNYLHPKMRIGECFDIMESVFIKHQIVRFYETQQEQSAFYLDNSKYEYCRPNIVCLNDYVNHSKIKNVLKEIVKYVCLDPRFTLEHYLAIFASGFEHILKAYCDKFQFIKYDALDSGVKTCYKYMDAIANDEVDDYKLIGDTLFTRYGDNVVALRFVNGLHLSRQMKIKDGKKFKLNDLKFLDGKIKVGDEIIGSYPRYVKEVMFVLDNKNGIYYEPRSEVYCKNDSYENDYNKADFEDAYSCGMNVDID